MRLLNTETWEMKEFVSHEELPPYAILSHTWQNQEVTYQDWDNGKVSSIDHMAGLEKIKAFGRKAAFSGLEWIWVDT